MILSLIGLSSATIAQDQKLVWFESSKGVMKVQAPSNWKVGDNPEHFQVMTTDGSVVLTMAAYGKEGGSLGEFTQYRFSSIQDFYKATSNVQTIKNGSFIEFEGTWPGENKPTYYVVAASQSESVFFSLGLVTDRADFTKNKQMYISMFESISVIQ